MSVTTAFSAAIASAVADLGKSPKSVFRFSSDAKVATAKMGDDTLELSEKTGNLKVRLGTGRAVAVVGIGPDGVLRIDCGDGPAELADGKLASEVKSVVEAVASAHRNAVERGNRSSFAITPGEVGIHLHDELDGKSWHWLTTSAEIAEDRKAVKHDFEASDGEWIVASLRSPSGKRIGTALIGTDGLVDFATKKGKTADLSDLSGPRAIGVRLMNAPDAVDLPLGAGEWEGEMGIVVLDERDIVHNAFGPASWTDDTWHGVVACKFWLDGKSVAASEYPYAAAASAAASDPSLVGDEQESTITKWVARRVETEARRLGEQKNVGILEIVKSDAFFVPDGSNLFERMARGATAETVERICVFARFGVEKGDRNLFVEGALAAGLIVADRASPARLATFAKKAGAPEAAVEALASLDAESAKEAVARVMGAKLSDDWSGLVPARPKSSRKAA